MTQEKMKTENEEPPSCPLYLRKSNNATMTNKTNDPVASGRDVQQKSTPSVGLIEQKMKHIWHHPHKAVFKPFLQCIEDYSMIKDGDKVLVCLSGGKDSMSLLHAVKQYQYVCRSKKINFEFGAVTVDPKTPAYNPSSLKPYLAELGVPYFYEEQCIIDSAANLSYECASICSFCSRMKRGRIYETARKNGYNVLALGQHLDDFTERYIMFKISAYFQINNLFQIVFLSFMMSLFFNGKLWCMKAHYKNEEQDLRIIRPFVYVREKELRSFAESKCLPIIAENCPACFEAPKERQRVKQLLAQQELNFPNLFGSLLTAIKPIFSINKTQLSVKTLTEFAMRMVEDQPELYKQIVDGNDSELIEDSL